MSSFATSTNRQGLVGILPISGEKVYSLPKLIRTVRLFRLVKLFRMMKLADMLRSWQAATGLRMGERRGAGLCETLLLQRTVCYTLLNVTPVNSDSFGML